MNLIQEIKKQPNWYRLMLVFTLLPVLGWPILFYMSIFIFDNPSNKFLAYLLFLSINSYPVFLIGISTISLKIFKKQKKLAVLLISIPLSISISILSYMLYDIFISFAALNQFTIKPE